MRVTVRSDNQVVQLSLNSGISLREALDATELRVRAACGGLGTCGACLIQIASGSFNPPTPAERQKIRPEELAIGMRLACQLRAGSDGKLYLQHPAPHSEWKSLDASQLCRTAGNAAITEHVYGVAVDLGTTHIRLSCLNTGVRIMFESYIQSYNEAVFDWTEQQTRAEVKRIIDIGKPGGHFLFGTGVMPLAIPEANIRAMLDAAFEYGRQE